jgi:hypothetical protein
MRRIWYSHNDLHSSSQAHSRNFIGLSLTLLLVNNTIFHLRLCVEMVFAKEGILYYSPCAKRRDNPHRRLVVCAARAVIHAAVVPVVARLQAKKASLLRARPYNRRRNSPPHHVFYFSISYRAARSLLSNGSNNSPQQSHKNNACVTRKCIKIHAHLTRANGTQGEKCRRAGCLIEVAPWEIFFGQNSEMLVPLIIILWPSEELRNVHFIVPEAEFLSRPTFPLTSK